MEWGINVGRFCFDVCVRLQFRYIVIKIQWRIVFQVGDLRYAEEKPPDNVLFICKLNPVTTDEVFLRLLVFWSGLTNSTCVFFSFFGDNIEIWINYFNAFLASFFQIRLTLFVFYLQDLEIIFSRFGKIECCEIIRDRRTGASLQYAFVEFKDVIVFVDVE